MGRRLAILVLLASLAPRPGAAAPAAIEQFSSGLPAYFLELQNYVGREDIRQDVFNFKTGVLSRRRHLVAEFQINGLVEEPAALWEFRFVREVDGKKRGGIDEEISRLASIRHVGALKEREQIVRVAMTESLPGCYWHNLNLSLLAFRPEFLDYYEWIGRGDHFDFRQIRGPGLPEDFFNPRSLRHYPTGQIWLTPDGRGLTRLDLRYETEERSVRMSLTFDSPKAGQPILPKVNVVDVYRPSSTGGALSTETASSYSEWKRFDVSTETDTQDRR